MMRRQFSREFKTEAVHLVTHRGVSVAQAARDLDVHERIVAMVKRVLSKGMRHIMAPHGP